MGQRGVMQMADQISGLMADRLKIRGDFESQLRRAKRFLPRRVFAAGRGMAEALQMAGHPKFRAQVDLAAISGHHARLLRHLQPIGRAERRRNLLLDFAARLAFTVLVVGGLWLTAIYLAQYR